MDDRDEPGQGDLELFSGRCKQPVSLNRTAVAQRPRKRGVGKAYTFFAMISTAVRFLDQRLSENFTPFRKRKLGCSALILTQNQFVKLICLQKRHVGKFYNFLQIVTKGRCLYRNTRTTSVPYKLGMRFAPGLKRVRGAAGESELPVKAPSAAHWGKRMHFAAIR